MYEQMKNDFLLELSARLDLEDSITQTILSCLDVAIDKYNVTQKETQISPYVYMVPKHIQMYLVCKSVEGYSEKTLYNYNKHLTNLFLTIQKPPDRITANDIRVYLFKYQQERGISNRSLEKLRSCISSFFKWLIVEGYIDKDPTLGISKIKFDKKPKTPCTQIDLEYLRKACETPKQKAVLEVLYSTGCRVGELVTLKKEDINWQDKTVHLFGKGNKHRTSFLNAKAEVALKEYLETRTDDKEWLFVSDRKPHDQMHNSGIQKIIRSISERAGSNVNKNVTPHILRHTMATRMIETNSDITSIQKILGHTNINTTMTYVHNTLESAKIDHNKSVV